LTVGHDIPTIRGKVEMEIKFFFIKPYGCVDSEPDKQKFIPIGFSLQRD